MTAFKFRRGFTLLEILISIAIAGTLAAVVFAYLVSGRDKARDAKRKSDLTQYGRFLAISCYLPEAGPGDYDLAVITNELIVRNPQYRDYLSNLPHDPKLGSDKQTYYRYIVDDNNLCALYANLEYAAEAVTLPDLRKPTAGGGQGVLEADSKGWNGTTKYFQFSN
jgi:prepilin-type N-terminal cleavage/methylation domain-containing protein